MPIVSIVVPFLVNQKLHYRILTIKLVNQKRNYNGDYIGKFPDYHSLTVEARKLEHH